MPAFDQFLDLSVFLTGFNRYDLEGTGQPRRHYDVVRGAVGEPVLGQLLDAYTALLQEYGEKPKKLEKKFHESVYEDDKLGPVCQSIVVLWYLGQWKPMPCSWQAQYGWNQMDVDRFVSAEAYREGLVWKAIHAHPMSAKAPGFGTWAFPPGEEK